MRCQICDFCETTPSLRNYQTDYIHHGNRVRYYPKLAQDLCSECAERVSVVGDIYRDQAAKFLEDHGYKKSDYQFNKTEYDNMMKERLSDTEDVQNDPSTLSEV